MTNPRRWVGSLLENMNLEPQSGPITFQSLKIVIFGGLLTCGIFKVRKIFHEFRYFSYSEMDSASPGTRETSPETSLNNFFSLFFRDFYKIAKLEVICL
mgnify:CR=1 FL=1